MSLNYFLLIGKEENWKISISEHLWGMPSQYKKFWESAAIGDLLAFYVTKPTKKIIGFGKIKNKLHNDQLTWNVEKYLGECIWPYKISFDIIQIADMWNDGINLPEKMQLQMSQKKITRDLYLTLVQSAEKKWNVDIIKKLNLN